MTKSDTQDIRRLLPPRWCRSYDRSWERRNEAARQRKKRLAFYGLFVRPGDLCFDVGANIGNRTSVLLELGARVVCIEPQPACAKILRKTFTNHPRVAIVEKALGETESLGEISICERETTISTMSDKWKTEGRFAKEHEWTKTVSVEVTTLDRLIELHGKPVLCKIDVEGFELPVVKGLTIPIPFISFEFTREFFADAEACINHLLTIGPASFNASLGETMAFLSAAWMAPETLTATIRADNDAFLWGDIYAKFM